MKLLIQPMNSVAGELYSQHEHFHPGDAGLDLFFVEDIEIPPQSTHCIGLKIKVQPEDDYSFFIIPRSSIVKTPLRLSNSIGLIDNGYRGELLAAFDNIREEPYKIKAGERLLQIVAPDTSPIEFKLVQRVNNTSRGSGGLGSTGK